MKILVLIFLKIGCVLAECEFNETAAINVTSTQVRLQWTLSTECLLPLNVKIYVQHRRWLACPSSVESDIKELVYETDTSSSSSSFYDVKNLAPFSVYGIEFRGFVETNETILNENVKSSSLRFRTKPDVPDTKPDFVGISSGKQSVHVHWNKNADCRFRNGILSGYRAQLWGVSPWVVDDPMTPIKSVTLKENIYEYYFSRLSPFTEYRVQVHSMNRDVSSVNFGVFMKATIKTRPTVPNPPSEITVTPLDTSFLVKWSPEYPPTGLVEYYYLRFLDTEFGIIFKGYYVHMFEDGNLNNCPGEAGGNLVCWVIKDSIVSGLNYTFQIKTKNVNVSVESDFSGNVTSMIVDKSSALETSASSQDNVNDDKDDDNDGGGGKSSSYSDNTTLIVLIVLIGVVFLLVIFISGLAFKINNDKLKILYEQQTGGTLNYLPAMSTMSSRMTTADYVDAVSHQITEIQSRRLPEPPPQTHPMIRKSSCINDGLDHEYNDPVAYREETQYLDLTIKERIDEDEEDISGYLAPTFPRISDAKKDSSAVDNYDGKKQPDIPMQSYSTKEDILNTLNEMESQSSSLNQTRPTGYIDLKQAINQSNNDILSPNV